MVCLGAVNFTAKTKQLIMKKSFIWVALMALVFVACNKTQDCPPVTVTGDAAEVTALKAQLTAAGIVATEDSRGFFYSVQANGTGAKPTPCSGVSVNYVGKLMNGTTFDAGTTSFNLSQLIVGWQLGLPLIGSGGKITLYLPPSLGYGSSPSGIIPAHSNLTFIVELNSVY